MHARTASWDSLLPTELEENGLSTNHCILRSSYPVLTQQAQGDSTEITRYFLKPSCDSFYEKCLSWSQG